MNITELFLDKYKELETVAKDRYHYPNNESAVSNLEERPEFRYLKIDLGYCREVRNLLQHKPKVNDAYAVVPSENMISLLEEVIRKVKYPPRAIDIAIPISKIFYRSMDDLVRPTMIEMQEKIYTHIPILDHDKKIIGVFSENTVLSYLINDKLIEIDNNKTFSELKEYLPIDKHKAEVFRFVGPNLPAELVRIKFEDALSNGERIGLVFVTSTGKKDGSLQGIITAWDVAVNQS